VFDTQNMRVIKTEVLRLIRSGSALRPSLVDIGTVGFQLEERRHRAVSFCALSDSKSPVTLMTLVGSVPAHVNGEDYEIPITVWLTDSFPRKAPPVYVTPNSGAVPLCHTWVPLFGFNSCFCVFAVGTMLDPLQRLVDEKGCVRIPYLESWSEQVTRLLEANLRPVPLRFIPIFFPSAEHTVRLGTSFGGRVQRVPARVRQTRIA
jgi:hypothetical protein